MFHQRNRHGLVTLTNHGISSESKDDAMLLTTRYSCTSKHIDFRFRYVCRQTTHNCLIKYDNAMAQASARRYMMEWKGKKSFRFHSEWLCGSDFRTL